MMNVNLLVYLWPNCWPIFGLKFHPVSNSHYNNEDPVRYQVEFPEDNTTYEDMTDQDIWPVTFGRLYRRNENRK